MKLGENWGNLVGMAKIAVKLLVQCSGGILQNNSKSIYGFMNININLKYY